MFNLANCRLHCSCSRGRCFKRLGAKAQIGCDDGARWLGTPRYSPRKQHMKASHFTFADKNVCQSEISV